MNPELSIKDLADTIQSRITKEAGLMSSAMIQSITTTLADTTRHLYEVLNSQQPLFKLPNEILAKIARNLVSCPMDEIYDVEKKPVWRSAVRETMILLPVIHTCRRLRQVIIADTTCWRHITTRNRYFVELSLSRCGPTHPLTMWLSPRSPTPMPLTEFHHQLAPRLRELHFHNVVPKNFSGLNRFLALPLPHLESFSWTGEMTRRDWSQWHDGMLPSSGLTTPNLRYLHIQEMRMLLPTTDLPHLTHLCISSFTESELPSLVDDVLQHCPSLTSLILRKLSSFGRFHAETISEPQSLHLPNLSRVVLADINFPSIQYFARLFASHRVPCLQIILTDQGDTLYAYQRDIFSSLYLQYWRSDDASDTSRLSVTAHTSEDYPESTGLSVTVANSTRALHISMSPKAVEWDVRRTGGGRSQWRESLLAPLRTLPDLREVWLTDLHVDTFMPHDSLPFCCAPGDTGRLRGPNVALPRSGQAQEAPRVPAFETIVVVYNCSARGCRNSLSIRPSLVALPKGPSSARPNNPNSKSESHTAPRVSAPPPLAHLRLVVGYDAADAPMLRETWESALLPGGKGQVEISPKLLRELAMDEYAYVRHAALRVQLMPHLALAQGELEMLRECFAAVDVEEIDGIPRVPVPECVRDDALAPGVFMAGSVLY